MFSSEHNEDNKQLRELWQQGHKDNNWNKSL
jgi:hypothetical protein